MSAQPQVKWRMKGQYMANCNCDAGCPCDFNRNPTHHTCEGVLGMNVQEGNFGDVPLSGVKWAVTFKFPGPLHEGKGVAQPFIDASATPKQREALLQLLSGAAGGPWFQLVSAVVSKIEDPQFVPISFQFDLKKRRAHLSVPGAFETVSEPIKNPVTGEEHRAQVCLPDGVEFKIAEVANAASLKSTGRLKFNWTNGNSKMAVVEHTPEGLRS